MQTVLPNRAQVVIIGGGVVGCSVAYHLARRGWTDVVLLERNQLTSGTTWHAAGLITTARPTSAMRRVVKRSIEVFETLEADTGLSTGWEQTGTLHLATNADRWEELLRQASVTKPDDIEVEVLNVEETIDKYPLLSGDGLVGSLFYPGDGRGNATDTTMSLARGARNRGVQIFENMAVTGIHRDDRRVTGVDTATGSIECEYVINCAGMWGREIGAMAGVQVPLQALAHYYVITEAIPGLARSLPTIKSSDEWTYVKNEGDGLMVGFFEPGSYAWKSHGIPGDAAFVQLPDDWEHLGPFYAGVMERIPALADAGIRLFFGGPESFTPDGVYHFGEAPELQNFFIAAGFNSTGFLTGPGIGSVMADWLVDGRPSIDLPEADPARVLPHETNRRFVEQRVTETLDVAYDMHWPYYQRRSARPLRRSALHAHAAQRGAVFGELGGWERPNWFAPVGVAAEYCYSYGRQNWFEHSAAEHRAVRESVGAIDISTYGKFAVQGRDACAFLQRICAADIDVEVGRIVYTQWLNRFGGIVADVTVTRIAESEFLVLSAPMTAPRDLAWLRRNIGDEEMVTVTDVSGTMAMIAVMGPSSRELLQPLTDCDLSNDAFPFGASRIIDLGLGFVRATRITYVGELGWELLVPYDIAGHIYDTVADAGARPFGYHALNSLRVEKGYRSWGHDISSGDSPVEAGLGFAVAWSKDCFIGRDAAIAARASGPSRRLVQFALTDPEPLLLHGEPILRDGICVGHLTSSAYGHTVGASIGMGYVCAPSPDVERAWFESGSFTIEVAGDAVGARASLQPLYDPTSARVR
ncbi:MAG TPA: FAD-dependent oxidoreductase [Ilumatobacteraceae bacterium]|nr:FAD-dependent oxidoreductase [Ilumatobacteraceae bacterium]